MKHDVFDGKYFLILV